MTWLKLIPYFVIAALVAALLWYRGNLIDAEAEQAKAVAALSVAKESNAQQAKAIEQLTERKARDDQILADISTKLAGINQSLAETNETISGLEKTDADVRKYLDEPIPDALRGVLNNKP